MTVNNTTYGDKDLNAQPMVQLVQLNTLRRPDENRKEEDAKIKSVVASQGGTAASAAVTSKVSSLNPQMLIIECDGTSFRPSTTKNDRVSALRALGYRNETAFAEQLRKNQHSVEIRQSLHKALLHYLKLYLSHSKSSDFQNAKLIFASLATNITSMQKGSSSASVNTEALHSNFVASDKCIQAYLDACQNPNYTMGIPEVEITAHLLGKQVRVYTNPHTCFGLFGKGELVVLYFDGLYFHRCDAPSLWDRMSSSVNSFRFASYKASGPVSLFSVINQHLNCREVTQLVLAYLGKQNSQKDEQHPYYGVNSTMQEILRSESWNYPLQSMQNILFFQSFRERVTALKIEHIEDYEDLKKKKQWLSSSDFPNLTRLEFGQSFSCEYRPSDTRVMDLYRTTFANRTRCNFIVLKWDSNSLPELKSILDLQPNLRALYVRNFRYPPQTNLGDIFKKLSEITHLFLADSAISSDNLKAIWSCCTKLQFLSLPKNRMYMESIDALIDMIKVRNKEVAQLDLSVEGASLYNPAKYVRERKSKPDLISINSAILNSSGELLCSLRTFDSIRELNISGIQLSAEESRELILFADSQLTVLQMRGCCPTVGPDVDYDLISSLSQLTNLVELDIEKCVVKVTDIDKLSNLTRLGKLTCGGFRTGQRESGNKRSDEVVTTSLEESVKLLKQSNKLLVASVQSVFYFSAPSPSPKSKREPWMPGALR